MKRIIYDVPRWHLLLHREARDRPSASDLDSPREQFEDELFDRLYSGGTDLLPEKARNPVLREWAEKVHATCEQLPAFGRLAQECKGRPAAAATAVEALMGELEHLAEPPETKSQQQRARRHVAAGCEKASAAVDELMETMEALGQVFFQGVPGTGTGVGADLPVSSIRGLARRLRDDARLRRIALIAGRFKRIAASKRRQKVKHGADEITEITQGADIARLLPSELSKLARRSLRLLFMRDLLERQCLQYQLAGTETLGKGPLVVALDKSGSMEGPRDIWATALALALLDQAQREKRMFALLLFDGGVKYEAIVKPREPLPEAALFQGCGGGTSIDAALTRALKIIDTHPGALRKADVVLVTDGASDESSAPELRQLAERLNVTLLGLGIGVSADALTPWCSEVHAVEDLANLDAPIATSLFAA
ncbi:MAG: VWA domain-containing protein [Anaeromyxobacter sp. RBG_16_69_14]|nr:MAG: VWA domain-containing protein [Anaeromyxobacter sp. RBG_16_69_14]